MVCSCHRPAPPNGPFRRCRLAFLAVASRTQTEEDAMRDRSWWRPTAAVAALALAVPLGGAPATAEADRGGGPARVVVAWNLMANQIAFAEDQFLTFKGARAYAEAAGDGNPGTAPDPTWEPLRTTPPFPDYVSAHSAVCGSSMEILRGTFGDGIRFTMDSATAPPDMPTRSFDSFTAAADECADSRVRLGFHFRYATDQGKRLGRRVAEQLQRRYFRPAPKSAIRRGTV
jgi:hypothetical protein